MRSKKKKIEMGWKKKMIQMDAEKKFQRYSIQSSSKLLKFVICGFQFIKNRISFKFVWIFFFFSVRFDRDRSKICSESFRIFFGINVDETDKDIST